MELAEQEQLKEMTSNNSDFHYSYMDRVRQDVSYYIRIQSEENAQKALKTAEFVLSLFKDNDIPEWYDRQDLKQDIEKFETTFNKKSDL